MSALPSMQPIAHDPAPNPAPVTRRQLRDPARALRAAATTPPHRKRRIVSTITMWLCGLLVALAVAAGALAVFAPSTAEYLYGQAKTGAQSTIDKGLSVFVDTTPTVRLGGMGGHEILNHCDGTFTGMSSYGTQIPTVYAAHNDCGGDQILPWKLGQRVNVVDHAGNTRLYTVVDIRNVPKTWGTVDDLVGIKGEFALQTCFYGQDLMKFVGLTPSP